MTTYTDLSSAKPVTCPRTRCESAYSLFANGRQLNANLNLFHTQLPDPHIAELAIQTNSQIANLAISQRSLLCLHNVLSSNTRFVSNEAIFGLLSAFRFRVPVPQTLNSPHLIRIFHVFPSNLHIGRPLELAEYLYFQNFSSLPRFQAPSPDSSPRCPA